MSTGNKSKKPVETETGNSSNEALGKGLPASDSGNDQAQPITELAKVENPVMPSLESEEFENLGSGADAETEEVEVEGATLPMYDVELLRAGLLSVIDLVNARCKELGLPTLDGSLEEFEPSQVAAVMEELLVSDEDEDEDEGEDEQSQILVGTCSDKMLNLLLRTTAEARVRKVDGVPDSGSFTFGGQRGTYEYEYAADAVLVQIGSDPHLINVADSLKNRYQEEIAALESAKFDCLALVEPVRESIHHWLLEEHQVGSDYIRHEKYRESVLKFAHDLDWNEFAEQKKAFEILCDRQAAAIAGHAENEKRLALLVQDKVVYRLKVVEGELQIEPIVFTFGEAEE